MGESVARTRVSGYGQETIDRVACDGVAVAQGDERKFGVLRNPPRSRAAARVMDLLVIALILPVVLVVGGVVALLIVIDSPGPVFYRSRRVGFQGREFWMLKFRKMRVDSSGPPLTLPDDRRFTPIGKFLSLTKLDELPQVWNVVKGDMRLVGPRPELPDFVAHHAAAYEEILSVHPGITGTSQLQFASEGHLIHSASNPTSFYSSELMPEKIAVDCQYVRNRTLHGDLAILVRTIVVPIWRITHRGHSNASQALGMVPLVLLVVAVFALVSAYLWATLQAT